MKRFCAIPLLLAPPSVLSSSNFYYLGGGGKTGINKNYIIELSTGK